MRTKAGTIFCLSVILPLSLIYSPPAAAQQRTPASQIARNYEEERNGPKTAEKKTASGAEDEAKGPSPSIEDRLKAMEQIIERQQREIQTLREMVEKRETEAARDGKSADPKSSAPSVEEQMSLLIGKLRKLEEMVQHEQRLIDTMQSSRSAGSEVAPSSAAAAAVDRSGTNVSTAAVGSASAGAGASRAATAAQAEQLLSLRIGTAYITPVGFLDFTAVFRSTNNGSSIGTNFGSIPFNNSPAGKLTETRFSAQNSRVGARIDADVKGAHVIGWVESDFLGFVPGNAAASSNSDSLRLRLYWVDVRKGKLEVLGGQSWSMLNPGRKGISPIPSDIFYTQNMDVNYQVGLTWTRAPQFRLIYHPSDVVTLGLGLENPEQYIGGSAGGGVVVLPSALATSYAAQLNNGNTALAVPNLHPDIIAKATFDPVVGDRSFHIEFAGVTRSFKLFNPLTQTHFTTTGGGGSVNVNLELVKNFHFISNNYYSDGGGRYIFGQAPDLIVRGDGSASLIHTASTVTGFEAQAAKNTLLYGYYGGVYIQRNTAIDPANGKLVGYGFPGSPSGQNRSIQESTLGLTQTLWRDPKYGALQLLFQYSYVNRHPWSVATGQPSNAHTNMLFLDLRYVLPGSAPKVK